MTKIDMKTTTKSIRGVIGSDFSKHNPSCVDASYYFFTITDAEDGKVWNIIASGDAFHWHPDEDEKHFCVRGVVLDENTILATYIDRWGRYCDHCGKHHEEGWYINEWKYACSDECAYALCGGKDAFEDTIILDEDGELSDESATYWTEWEA